MEPNQGIQQLSRVWSQMKRVAILQSNYIPWKGYFDLINSVDLFVVYDHVQFTKHDWRNRNRIKTESGLLWLTIPVRTAKNSTQSIRDTRVSDSKWAKKHLKSLETHLGKAAYYHIFRPILGRLYEEALEHEFLHDINILFLNEICRFLQISTTIKDDEEFEIPIGTPTSKLISICEQAEAATYVTGPSALDYLEIDLFKSAGLNLEIFDYSKYSRYSQLHRDFVGEVSAIDLLANTGTEAKSHLLGRTSRLLF